MTQVWRFHCLFERGLGGDVRVNMASSCTLARICRFRGAIPVLGKDACFLFVCWREGAVLSSGTDTCPLSMYQPALFLTPHTPSLPLSPTKTSVARDKLTLRDFQQEKWNFGRILGYLRKPRERTHWQASRGSGTRKQQEMNSRQAFPLHPHPRSHSGQTGPVLRS